MSLRMKPNTRNNTLLVVCLFDVFEQEKVICYSTSKVKTKRMTIADWPERTNLCHYALSFLYFNVIEQAISRTEDGSYFMCRERDRYDGEAHIDYHKAHYQDHKDPWIEASMKAALLVIDRASP